MKNIKIYKLSFLILQFIFSVSNLLSFDYTTDLQETPLGFYHQSPKFKTSYQINPLDLPEEHRLEMTPVKDQGPTGTCVSFTTSACGEFLYKSSGVRFSEAEFTILAETEDPTEPYSCKAGLFLGNALRMAHKYGLVEDSKLPYDRYLRYVARKNDIDTSQDNWETLLGQNEDADICVVRDYNATMREIPADISFTGTREDISPFRLTNLYPIHHVSRTDLGRTLRSTLYTYSSNHTLGIPANTDIDTIKQFLYRNHPVAVAVPVFENCWPNSGEIKMPQYGDKDRGSHAVVICGYDDEDELFTIKNSWGDNVGRKGFYKMPYEYAKTYILEAIAVGR